MSEIEVNIGIQFRRCPGVASPHALIAILGTCRSTRPMFGSTAGSQCSRGYNVRRGRHPPLVQPNKGPQQPAGNRVNHLAVVRTDVFDLSAVFLRSTMARSGVRGYRRRSGGAIK